MKSCKRCKEEKDLSSFHKDPRNKDGLQSWCRPCVAFSSRRWYLNNKETAKQKSKEYHKNNREKALASQRKYINANKELTLGRQLMKYWPGSSPLEAYEKYMILLEAQQGKCAICNKEETYIDHRTGQPLRLSVDHCHKTGKVRGLLCARHNKAIGLLDESFAYLQNASDYLRKSLHE